ncbi:MAG: ABC transporter permease [Firmicutes bacterium]|nr:ABC transporter permease [Bacillota bacterium]
MNALLQWMGVRLVRLLAVLTAVLAGGFLLLYPPAFRFSAETTYRGSPQLSFNPPAHVFRSTVAAWAFRYGPNHLLWRETIGFVWHTWTFHFGDSFTYVGVPILRQVERALPITAQLVFGSLALGIVIGVGLGIIAALRQQTWLDRGLIRISTIGRALPAFVTAALIIWVFGSGIPGVLPVHGWNRVDTAVLPMAVLTLGTVGSVLRMMRGSLIEAMRQDYLRTAQAKGVGYRRTLWRHAVTNAGMGLLMELGPMVGFTVVSAVWVENQFAIPGMGTLTAIGVGNSDGPLLMTMFFTLTLFILLTRLGLDMLRRWWDPRSRLDAARCLSTGAFTHRYPR